MKSFLICPVRGLATDTFSAVVAGLEQGGYKVHWPPRDTDQIDTTELRICQDNRRAIAEADIVHLVWDGKSQGCLFDLGMAFAMQKPVQVIILPPATDGKSFQNMVRAWAQEASTSATPDLLQVLRDLNKAMDLGDLIYAVRESEGQGWDGMGLASISGVMPAGKYTNC